MRKPLMILSILVLCLLLAPASGAQGMSMFDWEPPWIDEFEGFEPPEWEVGQYVTYHGTFQIEGETMSGDLRFALVGAEEFEGLNYHWFEFDVFNIGDLPEDMSGDIMLDEFESLRVKLLMKEYNFTFGNEKPEQIIEDLIGGEFVKRVIFQVNDETPMEIDMSFLQMFAPMIEMMMEQPQGMEPEEDVMDVLEDIDWGIEEETVTTPAGTFADSVYLWFNMGDEAGNAKMKIYANETVPLTVLVKVAGGFEDTYSGETVDMNIELIDFGSGAGTWIEGEPEMFSFDMMGGFGPGGMMGEV